MGFVYEDGDKGAFRSMGINVSMEIGARIFLWASFKKMEKHTSSCVSKETFTVHRGTLRMRLIPKQPKSVKRRNSVDCDNSKNEKRKNRRETKGTIKPGGWMLLITLTAFITAPNAVNPMICNNRSNIPFPTVLKCPALDNLKLNKRRADRPWNLCCASRMAPEKVTAHMCRLHPLETECTNSMEPWLSLIDRTNKLRTSSTPRFTIWIWGFARMWPLFEIDQRRRRKPCHVCYNAICCYLALGNHLRWKSSALEIKSYVRMTNDTIRPLINSNSLWMHVAK